jgi:hypothetical protein
MFEALESWERHKRKGPEWQHTPADWSLVYCITLYVWHSKQIKHGEALFKAFFQSCEFSPNRVQIPLSPSYLLSRNLSQRCRNHVSSLCFLGKAAEVTEVMKRVLPVDSADSADETHFTKSTKSNLAYNL